jgi:hypothetical protein
MEPPLAKVLESADEATLQEIARQAEVYLDAQLVSATAADARALTFAGLIMAANVILVGASYSLVTMEKPNVFLAWTCVGLVAALFISSFIAVLSARSVKWGFGGGRPETWRSDALAKKTLMQTLPEQCQNYDEHISENATTMRTNSQMFNAATTVALTASAIAGLLYTYWLGWLR